MRAFEIVSIVLLTCACTRAEEVTSGLSSALGQPSEPEQRRITDTITQGATAPRIEVTDERGKKIVIDEMMGKPLVLLFWRLDARKLRNAKETARPLKAFQKMIEQYGDWDVPALAVHVGRFGNVVPKFLETTDLQLPVAYDRDGSAAERYGLTVGKERDWPAMFVISARGKVVAGAPGFTADTPDWMTNDLDSVLADAFLKEEPIVMAADFDDPSEPVWTVASSYGAFIPSPALNTVCLSEFTLPGRALVIRPSGETVEYRERKGRVPMAVFRHDGQRLTASYDVKSGKMAVRMIDGKVLWSHACAGLRDVLPVNRNDDGAEELLCRCDVGQPGMSRGDLLVALDMDGSVLWTRNDVYDMDVVTIPGRPRGWYVVIGATWDGNIALGLLDAKGQTWSGPFRCPLGISPLHGTAEGKVVVTSTEAWRKSGRVRAVAMDAEGEPVEGLTLVLPYSKDALSNTLASYGDLVAITSYKPKGVVVWDIARGRVIAAYRIPVPQDQQKHYIPMATFLENADGEALLLVSTPKEVRAYKLDVSPRDEQGGPAKTRSGPASRPTARQQQG